MEMARPAARGTGRALLAGDRVVAHGALRAALAWSREVAAVHAAADLDEAVALAADFDVVVVDTDLLAAAGTHDAVAALQAAPAGPEVIAASREPDPVLVGEALQAGARSFLLLTPDVRQARETVEAALDGRGLIGIEAIRPLLDRHAALCGAERARERGVVERLAAAVEAKDAVTSAHLRNVTRLAVALAAVVDPELADDGDFVVGCLLHDVGKLGVPERILTKPGPLTDDEWEVMRRHPDTGARVVSPLGLAPTVVDVVRHHHERWDGRGYPEGLAGEAIPLAARVFSVCDALEAMTAHRPYRPALPVGEAVDRVLDASGEQFDPVAVAGLERGLRRGSIRLVAALESRAAAVG